MAGPPSEWGKLLSTTGITETPYGYKGELGYYREPQLELSTSSDNESSFYLHHRVLDSATQRFRSADPAEDDLNLYRYVNNDPVNRGTRAGCGKTPKSGSGGFIDSIIPTWTNVMNRRVLSMPRGLTAPSGQEARHLAAMLNWGGF